MTEPTCRPFTAKPCAEGAPKEEATVERVLVAVVVVLLIIVLLRALGLV